MNSERHGEELPEDIDIQPDGSWGLPGEEGTSAASSSTPSATPVAVQSVPSPAADNTVGLQQPKPQLVVSAEVTAVPSTSPSDSHSTEGGQGSAASVAEVPSTPGQGQEAVPRPPVPVSAAATPTQAPPATTPQSGAAAAGALIDLTGSDEEAEDEPEPKEPPSKRPHLGDGTTALRTLGGTEIGTRFEPPPPQVSLLVTPPCAQVIAAWTRTAASGGIVRPAKRLTSMQCFVCCETM